MIVTSLYMVAGWLVSSKYGFTKGYMFRNAERRLEPWFKVPSWRTHTLMFRIILISDWNPK